MTRSEDEVRRLMSFIDSQRLRKSSAVGHVVDDDRAREVLRAQLRGDISRQHAGEVLAEMVDLDERSRRGALAWMHWLRESDKH